VGVRQKLNQYPLVCSTGMVAVVLFAVYFAYAQLRGAKSTVPTLDYYTTDDGKTLFTDKIDRLVPFRHGGKEAVRAHVFECNGKRFVGYLSKMGEQARAAVEQYRLDSAARPPERPASWGPAQAAMMNGWLIKKPGEKEWHLRGTPRTNMNCGDGTTAEALLP